VKEGRGLKVILLGISIILFGIAVMIATSGPQTFGLVISFVGLLVSLSGFSREDKK
jgi:hypothetical protein